MSVQRIPILKQICTRGWGTHPRPGAGSRTKAIRPSRTSSVRRKHRHGTASPVLPPCLAGEGNWEPSLHTSNLHRHWELRPLPAFAVASGSPQAAEAGEAWWKHQMTSTSTEPVQQQWLLTQGLFPSPRLQGRTVASWQGRHQHQRLQLTQQRSPHGRTSSDWPHTPETALRICLATLYRNPSPVLLLAFYLTKRRIPHATKPRDNAESRMHLKHKGKSAIC